MGLFQKKTVQPITDLHCHILPGVDDGARDVTVSEALLREERAQGVMQIMFTPHFYPHRMTLDDFLLRRYEGARQIVGLCERLGLAGALGAEVHMAPELAKMDLRPLAFADTPYLLLEWPFAGYPLWGDSVVYAALDQGLTPIFAHIERYDYLFFQPERLEDYAGQGVLFQMNADTLLSASDQKQGMLLIKNALVHVLSSDAHNMDKRPPRLEQAYAAVEKKLGHKTVERLKTNANHVFRGEELL